MCSLFELLNSLIPQIKNNNNNNKKQNYLNNKNINTLYFEALKNNQFFYTVFINLLFCEMLYSLSDLFNNISQNCSICHTIDISFQK